MYRKKFKWLDNLRPIDETQSDFAIWQRIVSIFKHESNVKNRFYWRPMIYGEMFNKFHILFPLIFFLISAAIAFECMEALIENRFSYVIFHLFPCRRSVKCVVQLYCIKLHLLFWWHSSPYRMQKNILKKVLRCVDNEKWFLILKQKIIIFTSWLCDRLRYCTMTDLLRKNAATMNIHPGSK